MGLQDEPVLPDLAQHPLRGGLGGLVEVDPPRQGHDHRVEHEFRVRRVVGTGQVAQLREARGDQCGVDRAADARALADIGMTSRRAGDGDRVAGQAFAERSGGGPLERPRLRELLELALGVRLDEDLARAPERRVAIRLTDILVCVLHRIPD